MTSISAPEEVLAGMPDNLRGKLGLVVQQYPDIAAMLHEGKWLSVCAALRNTAKRYDLNEMLMQYLAALEAAELLVVRTSIGRIE